VKVLTSFYCFPVSTFLFAFLFSLFFLFIIYLFYLCIYLFMYLFKLFGGCLLLWVLDPPNLLALKNIVSNLLELINKFLFS
jgi:hypothetical protein